MRTASHPRQRTMLHFHSLAHYSLTGPPAAGIRAAVTRVGEAHLGGGLRHVTQVPPCG